MAGEWFGNLNAQWRKWLNLFWEDPSRKSSLCADVKAPVRPERRGQASRGSSTVQDPHSTRQTKEKGKPHGDGACYMTRCPNSCVSLRTN
eukprot:4951177-Pleurochrysis_carterae.AAC.3